MNRVTIGNLLDDYEDDKIDIITGVQAHDIEIVPRKIVEMIIEMCEKDGATYLGVVANEALDIKKYAESLLNQFEEDDSNNTEKCSVEPLPDVKQKILAIDFDFGDYYDHTVEIQDKVLEVLDKEE